MWGFFLFGVVGFFVFKHKVFKENNTAVNVSRCELDAQCYTDIQWILLKGSILVQ